MTSLLFDKPFQVVLSADDSQVAFDCTLKELHNSTLTVTEHPVEEGSSVTDHAQKDPDGLQLTGIVSNHPILINLVEDLEPAVAGGDPNNRAQEAYNEFSRLQNKAALLSVSTEIRDYTDMMLTVVSTTRDKTTRNIMAIDLTLRQYRKAQVDAVDAPEPIEPAHRTNTKSGRQNTKPAAAKDVAKTDGVLEGWSNSLDKVRGAGGLF